MLPEDLVGHCLVQQSFVSFLLGVVLWLPVLGEFEHFSVEVVPQS